MEHLFDHAASSNPLDDLLKQLHDQAQFSALTQDDALTSLPEAFNPAALPPEHDWLAPTLDATPHETQFDPSAYQDAAHLALFDSRSPMLDTHLPDFTPDALATAPHLDLPPHDWTTLPDLHDHHFHAPSITFHSSSDDQHHPHLSLRNNGDVYQNDKFFGEIEGHTVYNAGRYNCGYYTNTGKVYDYFDHLVGEVLPNGHVYLAKSNGDLVDTGYIAEKGVAEGSAYLLLYWCGGQTHI